MAVEIKEQSFVEASIEERGYCNFCKGFTTYGVNCDAEFLTCEDCLNKTLMGVDTALIEGFISLVEPLHYVEPLLGVFTAAPMVVMPSLDFQIGQLLKSCRKKARMNQRELSHFLCISQAALSRIENGHQQLTALQALILRGYINFELERSIQ